jgi:hypothetical protein
MSIYNATRHPVYLMEVSFVLLEGEEKGEGEEERTTDQVIASMANLIRTDSFLLDFLPFQAKFVNLQGCSSFL